MTEQEYIEQKMAQYSQTFDFYIESGGMPESVPENDILGGYMKSVFDDNPQLDGSDPTWQEVLKENLMEFIEAMLHAFMPAERFYRQELGLIRTYKEGDIDKKREMWREVYGNIKQNFTASEVNIDTYTKQFATNDRDIVLSALINDWDKANREKLVSTEKQILQQSTQRFEKRVKEWGRSDYEAIRKVEKTFFKYPELKEIVKIIGRESPENKEEKDDIVYKYIPILPSQHTSHTDVEQISPDNDLNHLIPSETAILSDADTEILFYQKYASHQLQTFSNKPLIKGQTKDIQKNKNENRLAEGPIIVALDTSGSMSGKPIKVAHSLLFQLLRLAKKKHRRCFLIQFSVRAKTLDLTSPSCWKRLDRFLENGYSGGTDGEEMLNKALSTLQRNEFSMADVLVVSDFFFPEPSDQTRAKIKQEKEKGTMFYGLSIGGCSEYKVLDRIWKVKP